MNPIKRSHSENDLDKIQNHPYEGGNINNVNCNCSSEEKIRAIVEEQLGEKLKISEETLAKWTENSKKIDKILEKSRQRKNKLIETDINYDRHRIPNDNKLKPINFVNSKDDLKKVEIETDTNNRYDARIHKQKKDRIISMVVSAGVAGGAICAIVSGCFFGSIAIAVFSGLLGVSLIIFLGASLADKFFE